MTFATRTRRVGSPGAILATVCLAVFAINLDTTIVNVALPDLGRQLHASTRDLQWIVDGYNLAFAALVLTAGSIGDRFGRRPALLVGLVGFAISSGMGAAMGSPGALIAVRFVMGLFAALIFPTTLSVINNSFPDRTRRRAAIGLWGAVTGLGVAVGPVTGGFLLAHFGWPAVFLALIPVAAGAALLTFAVVPESSSREQARLDLPGLMLSSAGIAVLVYTIIEAPSRGWGSLLSVVGFGLAAGLAVLFVLVERRRTHPMLDVSLFRTPAFSAASGSVTLAFFALFGFIFLITQYMQFIRGWGTLSTGVRILPVAVAIAVGSFVGPILSGRVGTRTVVTTGLLMFGMAFAWIAISPTFVSYGVIVCQMGLMGTGLGLTSAPATESILSVLPPAKTGVGSAVNDATRETGGTLGVAIVGSIFTSVYAHRLVQTAFGHLPPDVVAGAKGSLAYATGTLRAFQNPAHAALLSGLQSSFMHGLHVACVVVAVVCWVGAFGALALPGRTARQVRPARTEMSPLPA